MEKNIFSSKNKIKRCGICGYAVYDFEISKADLEKYYKRTYKNWNFDSAQKDIDDEELFLSDMRSIGQYDFIKDHISNYGNEQILEIGAGVAYPSRYIQYMKNNRPGLYVVEPGSSFQHYYEHHSITNLSSTFPIRVIDDNAFDYIHTSHWLEHVIDLDSIFVDLKRILERNGLLFIEVPNCNESYFKLDIKDTPHIHFFTENSMMLFSEKYDFEVLEIGTYWLTFKQYYQRTKGCLKDLQEQQARQNSMVNRQKNDGAWLRVLLKNLK
ncbi:MAG: methyltransferase domain-containing protein [Bacteroidota bacterium]